MGTHANNGSISEGQAIRFLEGKKKKKRLEKETYSDSNRVLGRPKRQITFLCLLVTLTFVYSCACRQSTWTVQVEDEPLRLQSRMRGQTTQGLHKLTIQQEQEAPSNTSAVLAAWHEATLTCPLLCSLTLGPCPLLCSSTLGLPPPYGKNTDGRQKETMLFLTVTQSRPGSGS